MNQPNDEQSVLATLRFCIGLINVIVVLGGLGLLAIATSAAIKGLLLPAVFIGACGFALLATVAWAAWPRHKRPPSPRASQSTQDI